MKRFLFTFSFLFIFFASTFGQWGGISIVKAALDIHQGNLILQGNNVTFIEGRFDINGSIIVEENATLILRNALLNFTQGQPKQHNLTLRNPSNGSPHLAVSNSTVTSVTYFDIRLYGNSTADISNSTIAHYLFLLDGLLPGRPDRRGGQRLRGR